MACEEDYDSYIKILDLVHIEAILNSQFKSQSDVTNTIDSKRSVKTISLIIFTTIEKSNQPRVKNAELY
jgi:hypothetical protein